MKIKVFSLQYGTDHGGLDDREMQVFLADKDVIDVREHFFVHEDVPTWVLLVSYREVAKVGDERRSRGRRSDWRRDLSAAEGKIYDRLREWRAEWALADGRPVFSVLTNRQLAEVAKEEPDSLQALRSIEGIGPGKVSAFGEELLELLRVVSASDGATSPDSESSATEGEDGS